jgi:hypothetical protein
MKENQSHEARRLAFIREHHPDRGGDPSAFIAGLRALESELEQASGPVPGVIVVRRKPWLVRKATAAVRRLRDGPSPSRVRLPSMTWVTPVGDERTSSVPVKTRNRSG